MSSDDEAEHVSDRLKTKITPLPPELQRIAEIEFGETEDGLKEALMKLTQLLLGERDLNARTDPEFLLRFLRVRKFKVNVALKTIKNYYRNRAAYASLFSGLTPSSVKQEAKCLHVVLPERDVRGRLVLLTRIGAWMPDTVSYEEFQQACVMCLDHMANDSSSQMAGISYVVDFGGYTTSKMFSCNISLMKRGLLYLQDSLPLRTKAIHVVRESYAFDLLFAVLRPFIKKKIRDRISCHGWSFENLHKQIPASALPEEYGGDGPAIDFDAFWKGLDQEEPLFIENNRYGYQMPDSGTPFSDDDHLANTTV
ncbi:alpha-tocopherol transfer protein-like [Ixodes scapularis]|uniref:alpha-tocopherol transfer protein-like n=1 Tax=Ixodes scapularis TaxID=6945 RepID=UPI001A9DC524|nr:alpha-tocopherol transfer protein-like [Ixodes scapularis]